MPYEKSEWSVLAETSAAEPFNALKKSILAREGSIRNITYFSRNIVETFTALRLHVRKDFLNLAHCGTDQAS
jgi:hypothetical protein